MLHLQPVGLIQLGLASLTLPGTDHGGGLYVQMDMFCYRSLAYIFYLNRYLRAIVRRSPPVELVVPSCGSSACSRQTALIRAPFAFQPSAFEFHQTRTYVSRCRRVKSGNAPRRADRSSPGMMQRWQAALEWWDGVITGQGYISLLARLGSLNSAAEAKQV